MEFKEAMRIWKRMCKCQGGCDGCPAETVNVCETPEGYEESQIERFSVNLAKWAAEHPEKTIADDFFEKFPNAPRDDANNPYPCAKDCGYSKPPYCERTPIKCDNCWRRPLEEE